MTAEQRAKIGKRMLWIIPGLILAIIGDYCMGCDLFLYKSEKDEKEAEIVRFLN